MEMLNIKINGKDYQVEKNTTILASPIRPRFRNTEK